MSTQVATSTSQSHTIHAQRRPAPLQVPRRPPRTDVTQAIQKFLPYVVVFLLSLMLYTSLKPTATVYPPYSPPNVAGEHGKMLEFARDMMNRRSERLEEMKRKSEENAEGRLGQWGIWRAQKANELNKKIEAARAQAQAGMGEESVIAKVNRSLKDAAPQVKNPKDIAVEAADWWRAHGGEAAEGVKDFASEVAGGTKEFAYDAMYSWKQTASGLKDAGASKWEDVKDMTADAAHTAQQTLEKAADVGRDTAEKAAEFSKDTLNNAAELGRGVLENVADVGREALDTVTVIVEEVQVKATEAVETTRDTLQSTYESVVEGAKETIALEKVVAKDTLDATQGKLGEVKEVAAEWMSNGVRTLEDAQHAVAEKAQEVIVTARETLQNTYEGAFALPEQAAQAAHDFSDRFGMNSTHGMLSSFIDWVKSGLAKDEEVRRFVSMKEEWGKIDFSQRTDQIVQQLRLLGDDVVEEVVRKLGAGSCPDFEKQAMCPRYL